MAAQVSQDTSATVKNMPVVRACLSLRSKFFSTLFSYKHCSLAIQILLWPTRRISRILHRTETLAAAFLTLFHLMQRYSICKTISVRLQSIITFRLERHVTSILPRYILAVYLWTHTRTPFRIFHVIVKCNVIGSSTRSHHCTLTIPKFEPGNNLLHTT